MATGNMKTIKRRIKSVSSTMQITKAMELVASSKLRRAKQRMKQARPYFEAHYRILSEMLGVRDLETVFIANKNASASSEKTASKRLYIVIAGDRGLAGGYNSTIFKLVAASQKSYKKSTGDGTLPQVIAIGKKSVEHFEKRGYDVVAKRVGIETFKSGHCSDVANMAIKLFADGKVDEVELFYTKFISSMVQEAVCVPLLPLKKENIGLLLSDKDRKDGSDTEKPYRLATYDPTPEAVFNRVVPNFLTSIIQCAVSEAYTSEQCARRIAMESASDNAEEMIENLSLLYNRARQEKITNEINEIVGGANAL